MDIISFVWYIGTLSLALLFISITKDQNVSCLIKKISLYSSFVILLFFSGGRFFVGNDYSNYVEFWKYIKDYNEGAFTLFEPLYYLINRITSFSQIGYLLSFAIASFLGLYLLYKVFKEEKCLFWGVFSIYVYGYFEFSFDVIRQGISIAIFIYSIKYLKVANIKIYLLLICIASLFHYSAICMSLLIFIRNLKMGKLIWVVAICIAFVIGVKGYAVHIISSLLMHIPYYGEAYQKNEKLLEYLMDPEQLGSGLGILFIAIQGIYISISLKRIGNDIYTQFFLLGTVLLLMSSGFYLANRIASYMFYLNLIVLPRLLTLMRTERSLVALSFFCGSLLYFSVLILWQMDRHGMTPYRNVVTENIYSLEYLYNQSGNEKNFNLLP